METHFLNLITISLLLLLSYTLRVSTDTDPNDVKILKQFRQGLKNPELLPWPEEEEGEGGDPCGTSQWKYIFCKGNRVTQIQAKYLNLTGSLPSNFNQLTKLEQLGLQSNNLNGPLPSFKGLSNLQQAFLNNNDFESIPEDFFDGLHNLQVLALDYNINLNESTRGWQFGNALRNSTQLEKVYCMSCNLVGPIPDFFGSFASLSSLKLSGNSLTGEIPATLNGSSSLQTLWLNSQKGDGLTGTIDVVTTMVSLSSLWLHGNRFSGTIPLNLGDLSSLKDLDLNGNKLVGLIPDALGTMKLDNLNLNNNHFMGPIPNFLASEVTFESNNFCQSKPGVPCSSEVMALLEFLGGLNYPLNLVNSWIGNNPCNGDVSWLGIQCNADGKVSMITLPNFNLSGTLSPSVAKLNSLVGIRLGGNKVSGVIPSNWTSLRSLTLLDLSNNNISSPLPNFSKSLKLVIAGNPLLNPGSKAPEASPSSSSPGTSPPSPGQAEPSVQTPSSASNSKRKNFILMIASIAGAAAVVFLVILIYVYCLRNRKDNSKGQSTLLLHLREVSNSKNAVKTVVANKKNGSISTVTDSASGSVNNSGTGEPCVIEAGNLVVSVEVIRNSTKNFAAENELGRGGFGVVYRGELDDGTKIAVKRMEAGVISSAALDEYQSEIAVLSRVRHRHLVSLLGYSFDGTERLIVYEYMPQGALSNHLFHWERLKLEPLSWNRRLNIALDVARGMEYLHSLAHQSFIHRDLKPSNILLGDDFRAKVSDFGLVKLAPDGKKSVLTRLAGTFGYLAPEYAVTGKITTKADVFSFGVVLMELLTGLMALDEDRPEENQYLAAWFWGIKSDKEKLRDAVDSTLDIKEETFASISIIAELAGHCTAREPIQRPDMGYAVNVLAPLVEKWKPYEDVTEECNGIDCSVPLNQMLKGWQEKEGKELSNVELQDSKSSIPAMPTGFGASFNSVDGR